MQVTTIETDGLGDRSYLITSGRTAVVIDPQRDSDRITELLGDDVDLALVCETHVHNDYVTGGLALARSTGAQYLLHADDDVSFDHRGVTDGEVIEVGDLTIRVIHTPGHTLTHLSYVVQEGEETAVFTGGSMLYDTVGRTDLMGPDLTDQLTRSQYRSVRGLAQDLPATTEVFPTHGFGSFCASAGGGSRTSGSIADEREGNLACTTGDEEAFVTTLIEGFSAHPPYYVHMGLLNRAGPLPPDLTTPPPADPAELAARIARGEWVVDVRPRTEFAAGHLAGSVNVDLEGALATHLGWAIPWGTSVSLLGQTTEQVAAAQRELVRIGIDRPMAIGVDGPATYAAGQRTASYPSATFADLAGRLDGRSADVTDGLTVLDVRRRDEWDEGHVDGAVNITMERLAAEADDLPDGDEVWVHCASGFRAAIAASLLARAGKRVTWIDDEWDEAPGAGVPVTR